jgi:hypothetical protein
MAKKKNQRLRRELRRRTRALRRRIASLDLVATGTLQLRTKTCGREGCPCMTDPDARHGPYHVWVRRRDGRLATTTLDADQARLLEEAVSGRREIDGLLLRWELEVETLVLGRKPRKPQR